MNILNETRSNLGLKKFLENFCIYNLSVIKIKLLFRTVRSYIQDVSFYHWPIDNYKRYSSNCKYDSNVLYHMKIYVKIVIIFFKVTKFKLLYDPWVLWVIVKKKFLHAVTNKTEKYLFFYHQKLSSYDNLNFTNCRRYLALKT